jgi:hypothetical protein
LSFAVIALRCWAFPPPRASRWLCEDPAFRLSLQPPSASYGPAVPGTPASVGSTATHHQAPRTGLPSLRCRAPPRDRTAISATFTRRRSTAPNASDGFFVKLMIAIPILRPYRSPASDDRRRVPPNAAWTHEKPVAPPRPSEFPHAAHSTPPQLALTHASPAGESLRTSESNPHTPARLA